MIHVSANADAAHAIVAQLAAELAATVDASIDAALEAIVQGLEADTPVRTGHMQASWFIEHDGPGRWSFGDAANYASFVADGTYRMARNDALHRALDDAEASLTAALDVAITRHLAAAG